MARTPKPAPEHDPREQVTDAELERLLREYEWGVQPMRDANSAETVYRSITDAELGMVKRYLATIISARGGAVTFGNRIYHACGNNAKPDVAISVLTHETPIYPSHTNVPKWNGQPDFDHFAIDLEWYYLYYSATQARDVGHIVACPLGRMKFFDYPVFATVASRRYITSPGARYTDLQYVGLGEPVFVRPVGDGPRTWDAFE